MEMWVKKAPTYNPDDYVKNVYKYIRDKFLCHYTKLQLTIYYSEFDELPPVDYNDECEDRFRAYLCTLSHYDLRQGVIGEIRLFFKRPLLCGAYVLLTCNSSLNTLVFVNTAESHADRKALDYLEKMEKMPTKVTICATSSPCDASSPTKNEHTKAECCSAIGNFLDRNLDIQLCFYYVHWYYRTGDEKGENSLTRLENRYRERVKFERVTADHNQINSMINNIREL
jgi:hypothetical protein